MNANLVLRTLHSVRAGSLAGTCLFVYFSFMFLARVRQGSNEQMKWQRLTHVEVGTKRSSMSCVDVSDDQVPNESFAPDPPDSSLADMTRTVYAPRPSLGSYQPGDESAELAQVRGAGHWTCAEMPNWQSPQ